MTAYALTPGFVAATNTTTTTTLIGPVPAGEEWVVDVDFYGEGSSGSGNSSAVTLWLTDQPTGSDDKLAGAGLVGSSATVPGANSGPSILPIKRGLVMPAGWRVIARVAATGASTKAVASATGTRRLTA